MIERQDAITFMQGIDDDGIDHVVTSPPYNYNLRIHNGKYVRRSLNERSKYGKKYHDALSMQEYFNFQRDCIEEMLRVARGCVFYNIQMLTGNKVALFKLFGHFAESIKEVLIWDKVSAEPAIGEGVVNSRYEFVIIFARDALARQFETAQFQRGTFDNVLTIPKNTKRVEGHNAIMPDLLAYEIIKNFTRPSDTILDPFAGTGTTLKAAMALGRAGIGCDIDAECVDYANKALEDYGNTLFFC